MAQEIFGGGHLTLEAARQLLGLPSKTWKAFLKQNGTDAPLITILENTTGDTFTTAYSSLGRFTISSPLGLFDASTTALSSTPSENNEGVIFPHISYQVTSANDIDLECYDVVGFALGDYLGVTVGTLIEIEIYL